VVQIGRLAEEAIIEPAAQEAVTFDLTPSIVKGSVPHFDLTPNFGMLLYINVSEQRLCLGCFRLMLCYCCDQREWCKFLR
jgi:hypothetical protein